MRRRDFAALLAGSPLIYGQRRTRQPNIVLLIADDLGYGDFGCYGQRLIQTPNVDRFASQGMRFTDCYAGGAVCAPSRCTLMTGLHQGHAAIRANAGTVPLEPGDVTVAEILKKAGYATGGFGKWGLGDAGTTGAPTRQGFDEFFGYLHQVHAHTYYPDFLWDNDHKFALSRNREGKGDQYSADLIAARSLEFIRKNAARPFFLHGCMTLPHQRFEPPDVEPYKDRPWGEGQKAYAAMVTRVDRYVGDVLKLLRQLNLERDTVVLITSDNGAHEGDEKGFKLFRSNGSLRGQKGELYEGGIRVPMMVRWPGRIAAGSINSEPWSFCDFLPTVAELSGAAVPRGLDGLSMLQTMLGKKSPPREYLYWEHLTYDVKQQRLREDSMWQAVRMGDWKAVRPRGAATLELYNLKDDPGETVDLAAKQPAQRKKLEAAIKAARTPPRPHTNGSPKWVT